MKKRILALILALVLVVPMVLVSCGQKPCETHVDEDNDYVCDACSETLVTSFFDLVNITPKVEAATVSSVKSFTFVGDIESYTEELLLTSESLSETITDSNGERTVNYTNYRVYNIASGTVVYEKKVEAPNAYTDDNAVIMCMAILNGQEIASGNAAPDDRFGIVTMNADNKTGMLGIYELNGTLVAEHDASDLDGPPVFYDNGYYVLDNVLYKNGTKIVDLDMVSSSFKSSSFKYTLIGDKYYACNNTTGECVVFDASFNVTKYIQLPEYSTTQRTIFPLANGDILVVYTEQTEIANMMDGDEYDFVVNGYAVNVDTYLVSAATGKMTQIDDLPLVGYTITPIVADEDEERPIDYKDVGKNVISGYEVVDGKIDTKAIKVYLLSNDAKLGVEIPGIAGFNMGKIGISVIEGTSLVKVITPVKTYIYNVDGTKAGEIPFATLNNNTKWFYYEDALYDLTFTKVYDIPEEYNVQLFADDVLYLSKDIEADPNDANSKDATAYYVYNGTLTEIFRINSDEIGTKSINFYNKGYRTTVSTVGEDTLTTKTYTFYSSNGTAIHTIAHKNTSSETFTFSFRDNGDNWVIVETKSQINQDSTTTETNTYYTIY